MTLPGHKPTAPSDLSAINPATGLSTDYLNHFTEAIMVLEMAASMPDCIEELRNWRPKTYCEHFQTSNFADRDVFITAYRAADPAVRGALDEVADRLNTMLQETRDVLLNRHSGSDARALALRASSWIMIARAAAIINGRDESGGLQAEVDALLAQ